MKVRIWENCSTIFGRDILSNLISKIDQRQTEITYRLSVNRVVTFYSGGQVTRWCLWWSCAIETLTALCSAPSHWSSWRGMTAAENTRRQVRYCLQNQFGKRLTYSEAPYLRQKAQRCGADRNLPRHFSMALLRQRSEWCLQVKPNSGFANTQRQVSPETQTCSNCFKYFHI